MVNWMRLVRGPVSERATDSPLMVHGVFSLREGLTIGVFNYLVISMVTVTSHYRRLIGGCQMELCSSYFRD